MTDGQDNLGTTVPPPLIYLLPLVLGLLLDRRRHIPFLPSGARAWVGAPGRRGDAEWVVPTYDTKNRLGLSTLLIGMVVTPAAIEIEEVFRQAIPAREGRPEVSAGNLVGTLLYFLWFNMGLISLLLPVRADPLVVRLDWPYLVGVTWLATMFFARGRVGRLEGALLVALYVFYVFLHTV
jgi:Ca2+/Na+ antiporter